MACICAIPAQAQTDSRWLDSGDVNTSHTIPVPEFRLQENNVPTEWYSLPDPAVKTQIDIDAVSNGVKGGVGGAVAGISARVGGRISTTWSRYDAQTGRFLVCDQ